MNITNLNAFYDKSHILHGVNLAIGTGEIVALLGRNGSGRSTLAKAIMGLVHATGQVQWRGANVLGHAPFQMAQAGVAYVPESRDIFPKLTVAQNLLLGQQTQHKQPRWSFEDMYNLFPRLRERANTEAGVLSGGEQQMLTLCRSLMGDPQLIIIDEPTEGLAPMVVEQVAGYLKMLKSKGVSVLLIEQKLTIAMDISDRVAVMGHGRIAFEGTPAELRTRADVRQEWLEVNG
jgi:branched-chain amino acid transport system ATP-binding protein